MSLGVLYAWDLYKCGFCPTDIGKLTQAVVETAKKADMQVVERADGFFSKEEWDHKYGSSVITLIVPLRESHLAVHTWPALRFASIDFYTCGDSYKAYEALETLAQTFQPERIEKNTIWRGLVMSDHGQTINYLTT